MVIHTNNLLGIYLGSIYLKDEMKGEKKRKRKKDDIKHKGDFPRDKLEA